MKKYLLCLLMAAPILSPSLHAAEPVDSTATSSAVTPRSPEAADTLPDQFLKEVVVKSERAWIEGNKAIFLPTKSEKNLANDAASLIKRMRIPTVSVTDGVIQNSAGKRIALFINGKEATQTDLMTFWPKLAKRVEYIVDPTDPQFKGASAIINFIMTEYEVGGISKIRGMQHLPNNGIYNVASKLVYKDMTYGLQVNGGYTRDHLSSSYGTESYHNVYYDGALHDRISRDFSGHSVNRNEYVEPALSAHYKTPKWWILNTASLRWNRNPGSGTNDSDLWTPDLFASHASASSSSSRQLSPQLSGTISHQINEKGFAAIDYSYIYARNHTYSSYAADGLSPILNRTKEDSHAATLTLRSNFRINQKLFVSGDVTSSMNWFSTDYTGFTNTLSKQWRGETTARLRGTWTFSPNISATLIPGLLASYWHVEGTEQQTKLEPTANASVAWTLNSKSSLYFNVYYRSRMPLASYTGNVILRQNELEWLTGNPNLHTQSTWMAMASAMWMPLNDVNISIDFDMTRQYNSFITVYESAPSSLGGILKRFANASPLDEYTAMIVADMSFLDNRLRAFLQPEYHYYNAHGRYANLLHSIRCRAQLAYTLHNCEFSIYYQSGGKTLSNGGMTKTKYRDHIDIGFSYGNGDINFDASVVNVFNSRSRSTIMTDAGVYSISNENLSKGRYAMLTLTYTFGYGKKVDRNINISGPSAVQSGVLGSD